MQGVVVKYPLCEKIIFLRKKSFQPEIRAGSPELLFCLPEFGKRKMKQTIQKCLHWIASDARQTIADVKYAFRRRSKRVLLAVQMAAWVALLIEFVIMSICLDYSWVGEIFVIWYFVWLVIDSEHMLSILQCVLSWIVVAAFTLFVFTHKMALW